MFSQSQPVNSGPVRPQKSAPWAGTSKAAIRARARALSLAIVGIALAMNPAPSCAQALKAAPSDSIVRLAVNASAIRGLPFVTLLDERTLILDSTGTSRIQVRQVVQLLDAASVSALSERAYGFSASHQELTIRWVRVLRPDGTVLSDKPAHVQDADVPAPMNSPIYSDQRVRRVSIASVAANTIIDLAFTMEDRKPPRSGDFFQQWPLNGPVPVRRGVFTLDVPAGYKPHISETNLGTHRYEEDREGRHRFRWETFDTPPVTREAFAADSNGVSQTVAISGAGDWNSVAAWYDTLARDRYSVTPPVKAAADSVLRRAAAKTRLDTIRAWHRWVTQDIRYLSVALGIGGYQPRKPEEVLRSGYGDCKDKATLFIALLRNVGIEAEPVILAQTGRPDALAPSIHQFNHVIAAVRESNAWRFTDLTAEVFPYGEIPEAYQGAFALQVSAVGSAREVHFPLSQPASNRLSFSFTASLDDSGAAVGSVSEAASGTQAPVLRGLLVAVADSSRRRAAMGSVIQRFAGREAAATASIDSLIGSDGRDMAVPPAFRYKARLPGVLTRVGDSRVLRVPEVVRGPARQIRALLGQVDTARVRLMAIDASRVIPPTSIKVEWRLVLPAGFTAELPPRVETSSFFGRYRSQWYLEGRELRVVRELEGGRGVFGPERLPEVLVWLRLVGADDQEFITLRQTRD